MSLREQIKESPGSLPLWAALVTELEQQSPQDKAELYSTLDQLLAQWPLLFGYWKKYTSLTYQLDGLEASLAILKRALDVFPRCVELWVDYLGILASHSSNTTATAAGDDDALKINGKLVDPPFVRGEFQRASALVGGVFMASEIWDKWVDWERLAETETETETDTVTGNVVSVLWNAIHVPLYEYNRIYTAFDKEWRLLPLETAQKITGVEGSTVDVLKEKFDAVFQQTQSYVAEIWQFESVIKQRYYNVEILNPEDEEVWLKYVEFQLNKYSTDKSELIKRQVISTFEQALIPMANKEKFWYKYLSFQLFGTGERDIALINSIYSRACNSFLPLSNFEIRLNWALFKESQDSDHDDDSIEEIYLSTISNNETALKPVVQYVKYLTRSQGTANVAPRLEKIVQQYFSTNKSNDSLPINDQRLLTALNDKLVGMLLTELIKIEWLILHDQSKANQLIVKFANEGKLGSCLPFWMQSYNFYKLRRLSSANNTPPSVNDIRWISMLIFNSSIPISYKQLIYTDLKEHVEMNYGVVENVLGAEYSLSFDRFMSSLAGESKKALKRDFTYPGFQNREKPEITNVDLDVPASETIVSALPTFKNVEKVSGKVEPLENE
jgi:pre-mRNA-processing factor 39